MIELRPLFAIIPLSQGKFALCDPCDYMYLREFNWFATENRDIWYARRHIKLGFRKYGKQYMHTGITGYRQTDHKDGNGLNNRRGNLRPTTHRQNQANRVHWAGNKSGFKGVRRNGPNWQAYIKAGSEFELLGQFLTKEDAARAYDATAIERFGEYACTNEMMGNYSVITQTDLDALSMSAFHSLDREAS